MQTVKDKIIKGEVFRGDKEIRMCKCGKQIKGEEFSLGFSHKLANYDDLCGNLEKDETCWYLTGICQSCEEEFTKIVTI